MGHISVVWETKPGSEETIIKWLIQAVGDYSLTYRDIIIKRDCMIRLKKRVNNFIEKYIKTDYRVHIPLLDKDDEHIDWCKTRISRNVDFELIKK